MKLIFPEQHKISCDQLDSLVFEIASRLNGEGYKVFLVGGGVRDLILCNHFRMNSKPKDFDLVTTAPTKKIRRLFANCRIVGRRFPICHIFYERNRKIFEVTSFDVEDKKPIESVISADAVRRDLEVNCLYLDLSDGTIFDPLESYNQLLSGRVKIVGDAVAKFKEDPVRIMRILRFISKTPLRLEPDEQSILGESVELLAHLGDQVRVFEEFQKVVKGNYVTELFINIFADRSLLKFFGLAHLERCDSGMLSDESRSNRVEMFRKLELFGQLPSDERTIGLLYLIIVEYLLQAQKKVLGELLPETRSKKAFVMRMQSQLRQALSRFAITKRIAEDMAGALFDMLDGSNVANSMSDNFVMVRGSRDLYSIR